MYYDRKGQPMEMEEWALALEDIGARLIGHTVLPDGTLVSTVWLGLNHGFHGGPPLIFETMVFATANTRAGELDCQRYATEKDARVGHEEMVAKLSQRH